MLINEAGLVRAIKRAYKHGGYVVANLGDAVAIYTENWYIQANRASGIAAPKATNIFSCFLSQNDITLTRRQSANP